MHIINETKTNVFENAKLWSELNVLQRIGIQTLWFCVKESRTNALHLFHMEKEARRQQLRV